MVTEFLFEPPKSYIDCNPTVNFQQAKKTSILSKMEDIFSDPRELAWLKLAGQDLNLINRDHEVWRSYFGTSKVSKSQLQSLAKKYDLKKLNLSAYFLFSNIKTQQKIIQLNQ